MPKSSDKPMAQDAIAKAYAESYKQEAVGKYVEAIRAAGGEILGVLALVDREEGGREALEAAGLTVISLVTATDLLPLIPPV